MVWNIETKTNSEFENLVSEDGKSNNALLVQWEHIFDDLVIGKMSQNQKQMLEKTCWIRCSDFCILKISPPFKKKSFFFW